MSHPLVGKYFIGVHDEAMRSAIVEAAIDDRHYLVRFDTLIGFMDGSHWPESLAVVAIDDMVRSGRDGNEDAPLPGTSLMMLISDAQYEDWINAPSPDRQPRVVPLRPKREE